MKYFISEYIPHTVYLNNNIYHYSKGGVWIHYFDGTKRFIANSWYVDIDTDQL